MKKDFLIENIDPLGQGVSKINDEIIFIKKTLPGESGITEITASKKGISFGRIDQIKEKSALRINPECTHFNQCFGCDFLHTKYENEIEFKKINIKRSLGFLGTENFEFHSANTRFGYRNRIQLHYNKKTKSLGFIGEKLKITPVPNCLIGTKGISKKLKELYENDAWLNLVRSEKLEGHIELYEKNNNVEVHVNQDYAEGGFTQVNEAMNLKLNAFLIELVKKSIKPTEVIFDLFGGNGNLTKGIENPTLVVDYYKKIPNNTFHQIFLHQDLYKVDAVKNISKFYSRPPQLIIFDPPRSGLKNIQEYLNHFRPETCIFIACDFASFQRDSKTILKEYKLNEAHVFDLFPGTHHFETIGIFTKINTSK